MARTKLPGNLQNIPKGINGVGFTAPKEVFIETDTHQGIVSTRTLSPTRTNLPKPERTRHHEIHIPGFVKNPPSRCRATQMERRGFICVDVLSCKNYCNDPECSAVNDYLDAADVLKISNRAEKED